MESRMILRYPYPFLGDVLTTVTQNASTVSDWLVEVRYAYLVPIDVNPMQFAFPAIRPKVIYLAVWPEEMYLRPSVLQLLVPGHCLLLKLGDLFPPALAMLLWDRSHQFVGSTINSSLSRLFHCYGVGSNAIRGQALSTYRFWPAIPSQIHVSIPRPLPYHGDIYVIVTHIPAVATRWIDFIEENVSGPNFHKKIIYLNTFPEQDYLKPKVLQILIPHFCLFFDLHHAPGPVPEVLRQFLNNRYYTFIGRSVREVRARLQSQFQMGGNARIAQMGIRSGSTLFQVDWRLSNNDIIRYAHQGFSHYMLMEQILQWGVYR